MTDHKTGTRKEWLAARLELLAAEKERPPGLRRRPPTLHHVFGDRRLRDFEAQHQQLAMHPGSTP